MDHLDGVCLIGDESFAGEPEDDARSERARNVPAYGSPYPGRCRPSLAAVAVLACMAGTSR